MRPDSLTHVSSGAYLIVVATVLLLVVLALILAVSPGPVAADPPVIAGDYFREDSFLGGFGWIGAWQTTNSVDIITDDSPHIGLRHLRMRGWATVSRALELSGPTDVEISFWAKAESLESSDMVSFEVSKDRETWMPLESWSGVDNRPGYRQYHYDLTGAGFDEDLFLRFRSNMNDPTDYFFLDGVRVFGELFGFDNPPDDDDELPNAPAEPAPGAVDHIVVDGQFADWEGYPGLADPVGDASKARGDLSLLQWANNGGTEVNYWMIERHPNSPHPNYDEDDEDDEDDDDDGTWRSWADEHGFSADTHGRKVKYTIYIDMDNDGDFSETDDRRVLVDYLPQIWDSSVQVRVKAGDGDHSLSFASGDWGESIAEGGRRVELEVLFDDLGLTTGQVIRMYVESNWDDRLPDSGDIQWSPASVLGYAVLAILLGASAIVYWRIRTRKEAACLSG